MSDLPLSAKEIGRLAALKMELSMAASQGHALRPLNTANGVIGPEYLAKLKHHTVYMLEEKIIPNPVPRLAMRTPYVRRWYVYRVEAVRKVTFMLGGFTTQPEAVAYIESLMVGRTVVGGFAVNNGTRRAAVPTVLTPESRAATLAANAVRVVDLPGNKQMFVSNDR